MASISYRERYLASTPRSRAYFERAAESLVGGTTRTTVYLEPYPPTVVRGHGSRVWDLDGNERTDLLNNYTALILGHAHPDVVAAVQSVAERGSAFAAPTEHELTLAELIKDRLPSVERLRFTSSGTEATMFAMRIARAVTGRPMIAKMKGGYHGTHDYAAAPEGVGIPDDVKALVIDLPFNDAAAAEQLLEPRKERVAAVIVEPILGSGGVIPGDPAFLQRLRELTSVWGMLLIFDEIISFRIDSHGAQGVYGITPDLTTLGKIIGGGFPVAAVGGRADVMDVLDQRRGRDFVAHGGTYNGNPVGTAAGVATMERLTPAVYTRLNGLGERIRVGLDDLFERTGAPASVTGIGSLFNIHHTGGDPGYLPELGLGLMTEGYWIAPRGMGCTSEPMTEETVDGFLGACERVITSLETV
jgi:glutamate-1-semialdehyde 2,1-aminomutase